MCDLIFHENLSSNNKETLEDRATTIEYENVGFVQTIITELSNDCSAVQLARISALNFTPSKIFLEEK